MCKFLKRNLILLLITHVVLLVSAIIFHLVDPQKNYIQYYFVAFPIVFFITTTYIAALIATQSFTKKRISEEISSITWMTLFVMFMYVGLVSIWCSHWLYNFYFFKIISFEINKSIVVIIALPFLPYIVKKISSVLK